MPLCLLLRFGGGASGGGSCEGAASGIVRVSGTDASSEFEPLLDEGALGDSAPKRELMAERLPLVGDCETFFVSGLVESERRVRRGQVPKGDEEDLSSSGGRSGFACWGCCGGSWSDGLRAAAGVAGRPKETRFESVGKMSSSAARDPVRERRGGGSMDIGARAAPC
jgi:hypothetical protein